MLCKIATEKIVHAKIKNFTFRMKAEVLMRLTNLQCLCIIRAHSIGFMQNINDTAYGLFGPELFITLLPHSWLA